MTTPTTPWHKQSFEHFLHRSLPDLLTERLRVICRVEPAGPQTCRILVQARRSEGSPEVLYPSLPTPDHEGVFCLAPAPESGTQRLSASGTEYVVLPIADRDDLAEAHIDCVGEQLFAFIESRLGHLPEDVEPDEDLLRTLLPLDVWFRAFLAQAAQPLRGNNWLDRSGHLRRLLVPDREQVFTPGHFGRACPFETPEGPHIGRVLTIARGAEVRDGRLVVVDSDPVAGLGLTAAVLPFLEHDDGNRVLMGVNMMRQWLPPAESGPALVQTGYEPDVPDFWCGRNLLTAFVSWDGEAFEDALVISATAAGKLACPEPLVPGDKLSNRHGIKGVVSRVLPDDDMPRLPDGTAVELIFNISGVPSRWTMGELREAALSHAARHDGRPAIVPPYQAPSDDELRRRLTDAGLPPNGMLTLTDTGTPLRRACTAGWVYWGCTIHRAHAKIHVDTGDGRGQVLEAMAVQALRDAGAEAVIRELTNTLSAERSDAAALADRVAVDDLAPASTPSPHFAAVAERLAVGGIDADADADGVTFRMQHAGAEATLQLAQPVPHPWLPDQSVDAVNGTDGATGFQQVADANARLTRLLEGDAPQSLADEARDGLTKAVGAFYDALLAPEDLTLRARVMFSGRAVITPGPDLAVDQLGIPEEMAWKLFGPLVRRRLGDDHDLQRTPAAADALKAEMAAAWIILFRAPAVGPTNLLAFHPVLCRQHAFRVHPLACPLMDADFDGDQAAVFLPLTPDAVAEAGERLSLAGHLRRDPDLISELVPAKDALFGLACLSRSVEGRSEIDVAAGGAVDFGDGIWDRSGVAGHLQSVLTGDGVDSALSVADALMRLGFTAARREGGSIGPFVGSTLELPKPPDADDFDPWQVWQEEVHAIVAGFDDYDDEDIGVVCLLSHSGARANTHQVASLFAPGGPCYDAARQLVFVRHSWREGLTPKEAQTRVVGARNGLFRLIGQVAALDEEHDARARPTGYGVLTRARRCNRPGIAFARAALRGEVDPLTDDYARLFVGLAPED